MSREQKENLVHAMGVTALIAILPFQPAVLIVGLIMGLMVLLRMQ